MLDYVYPSNCEYLLSKWYCKYQVVFLSVYPVFDVTNRNKNTLAEHVRLKFAI